MSWFAPSFRPAALGPALLFLAVFLAAAFAARPAAADEPLTLPLVVHGPEGYTVAVEVRLSGPADALYLQLHNPGYRKSPYADQHGYDKKASVRINGGSWVDIDNQRFECQDPDRRYAIDAAANQGRAGCIGGPLQTVRGRLGVEGLVAGVNTIEFRFNGTDGRTSGYRVLDLDVLSGTASRLETAREEDDPAAWQPIYTDAAALKEGRELFERRQRLRRSPRHDETLIASCADCHAADGRDLWYFNYEDQAIVARSEFHGLTREEGRKIASWIRSLPELDETVYVPAGYTEADLGRPWNPPYQPGPGLRDRPVELWAAGAGLEWVLDSEREAPGTERDMLTHLFPEGMAGEAGFARVHPDSALNVDEIPIAHQLPDWNNWLPEVHPFDWWKNLDRVKNSSIYQAYERMHEDFPRNLEGLINQAASDPTSNRGLRQHMHRFNVKYWEVLPDPPSRNFDFDAIAKLSWFQWYSTKQWELNQRYQLEGRFDDIYPGAGTPRGWPVHHMSVYFAAPHMNSRPAYPSTAPYADKSQNVYFSTAWYEMQLILNAGAKSSRAASPFDWNYHGPHILSTGERYGHPQALRYLQAQIVVKQQRNTFTGERFGRWSWEMKQVTPAKDFYGPEEKYQRHQMEEALDQGVRRDFVELLLRSFMEKTLRHDVSEWPRRTPNNQGHRDKLEHRGYVPKGASDPNGAVSSYEFRQNDLADSYYRYLNRVQQLGVDPALIDQAARWGEEAWPKGDWEKFFDDGKGRPAVSIVGPEPNAHFEVGADLTVQAEASSPRGGISHVAFYANGERLGEADAEPYRMTWENVSAGRYELRARAYDTDGHVAHSQAVIIRVGSEDDTLFPVATAQTIGLQPGWNMVSSYVVPEDVSMEAVFSDVEDAIEMVKDREGRVYSPEFGINDIGTWDKDSAYMVLARDATELRLNGNGMSTATPAVTLARGWNYMPFPSQHAVAAEDAFADLGSDVVFVKDVHGNIFFPEHDVDMIGQLEPGRGYEVYLRRERSIRYDHLHSSAAATSSEVEQSAKGAAGASASSPVAASPVSSILVIQASTLPDGSVVSAVAEDERLVGRTTVRNGVGVLVVAGNEPATEKVEGAREGESITLYVQKEDDGDDLDLRIGRVADYLTGERMGEELSYHPQSLLGVRAEEHPVASLEANYPNPFQERTVIPYSLRERTHVRIEVFDVLGRLVHVLVDEEQSADDHSVVLDATLLSSGVYFYRIQAGSHEETGKMILAR